MTTAISVPSEKKTSEPDPKSEVAERPPPRDAPVKTIIKEKNMPSVYPPAAVTSVAAHNTPETRPIPKVTAAIRATVRSPCGASIHRIW